MTDSLLKTDPPRRLAPSQKLIQLTDCHLYADPDAGYRNVRPQRTLEHVCRHVATHHPDPALILLTGDLSQDGSAESYRRLAALVSRFMKAPAYAIPGNHDDRTRMQSAFNDRVRLVDSIALSHWRIYLLDSVVPGDTAGLLDQDALRRLQHQLQQYPVTPTLVALHHHPVPVGSEWIDRLGLRNAGDLNALLRAHRQVKAVLFGHVHQEFLGRSDGALYLGTPSTCVQFKSGSLLFEVDQLPPAYRVIDLQGDGALDTRVEYVALPANL